MLGINVSAFHVSVIVQSIRRSNSENSLEAVSCDMLGMNIMTVSGIMEVA